MSPSTSGLRPSGEVRNAFVLYIFYYPTNPQLTENIFITGSIDQLKSWSPDNAIALNPANYPIWSVTVPIPASTRFSYKYIRKFNGKVTWESDPDRTFESSASGSSTTNDQWR